MNKSSRYHQTRCHPRPAAARLARALLSAVVCLCALDASAAYRIEHLEPPFWWTGMHSNALQLMVHGEHIAALEPTIRHPGVAIRRVTTTQNPNYLFIDLELAGDLQPGKLRIDFAKQGVTEISHEYTLRAREPGSAQRAGFAPSDVIYLITPDRFANANPDNDRVAGLREGPGRHAPFGRHGGDLDGVIAHLDYIADMGFTQIWLNPVLQNDQPASSYHGYATTDFYQVDARYGSNELYRTLSLRARERGIGLIMDVILNHCGSQHWWSADPPGSDWYNFDGRFVPTSHNRESLRDPHGADEDRKRFSDGWFVETMPDMNQRNPLVATYLVQNSIWWVEFAGLSGLRVDTYSYSDPDFLSHWSRRLTDEYPNLNIVGEEWTTNPAVVAYWQRGSVLADGYESSLPSLFDFPLQDALIRGLLDEETWATGLVGIYRMLSDDFLYADPYNLVTFPDNHDMSRVFTQLDEHVELYKMAIAFLLTTRGIPQLYYGSELLMANPGTESHGVIRSDFPGGWPGDSSNGFTGAGLSATQRDAQTFTRTLLNWRKSATAVHRGKLTHFAPSGGTYVYFRHTDQHKVMVVINKSTQAQPIDLSRFHEVITDESSGRDAITGQRYALDASFRAPPRSVLVLDLS